MKLLIKFWLVNFIVVIVSIIMPAKGNNWNIVKLSGDTLSNCSPLILNDSLITIEHDGMLSLIPVDSIKSLFIHKDSYTGTGAAVGAVTGVVLGTAIGSATYQKPNNSGFNFAFNSQTISAIGGGLLGGIVGSIAGLVIGASMGGNTSYDISKREHTQKVEIIRMLIQNK